MRLLNAAQAGGDEVSADSDISGAKLEFELELERPPSACEAEKITRVQQRLVDGLTTTMTCGCLMLRRLEATRRALTVYNSDISGAKLELELELQLEFELELELELELERPPAVAEWRILFCIMNLHIKSTASSVGARKFGFVKASMRMKAPPEGRRVKTKGVERNERVPPKATPSACETVLSKDYYLIVKL
jgi:hypothetical protein